MALIVIRSLIGWSFWRRNIAIFKFSNCFRHPCENQRWPEGSLKSTVNIKDLTWGVKEPANFRHRHRTATNYLFLTLLMTPAWVLGWTLQPNLIAFEHMFDVFLLIIIDLFIMCASRLDASSNDLYRLLQASPHKLSKLFLRFTIRNNRLWIDSIGKSISGNAAHFFCSHLKKICITSLPFKIIVSVSSFIWKNDQSNAAHLF